MFSSCQEQVGSGQVGHRTATWAAPPNLSVPSWQLWHMGQEPQGLQAVSKPCWGPWLSSSVRECWHGNSSQSRAPALPLRALVSPPLCRKEAGGTKVPREEGGDLAQRRAAGDFTFWQDSRNSSIVTTPSLFRSIFCRQAQHRGHSRDSPSPRENLLPPAQIPQGLDTVHPWPQACPSTNRTSTALLIPRVGCFLLHPLPLCAGALFPQDVLSSPGRSSPRALGALPPAWPGRCICPSCRRWTS